jgi:cytoskeletal protein RodZ
MLGSAQPGGDPSGSGGEPYSGIGAELRVARNSTGYELEDVAGALRIRLAHLQAIEEGRFADLPGPVYALGFLRSYAEFLGLDGDVVVKLFKQEARSLRTRPKLVFPSPAQEGNLPRTALVVFSLVAATAVWGFWHYQSSSDRTVVENVTEVPDRLASMAVPAAPPGEEEPEVAASPEATGLAPEPQPVEPAEVPQELTGEEAPRPIETAAVQPPSADAPAEATPETAQDEPEVAEERTGRPAEETPAPAAAVAAPPVASPPSEDEPDVSMDLPAPPLPERTSVTLPPPMVIEESPSPPALTPRLDEMVAGGGQQGPASEDVAIETRAAPPVPRVSTQPARRSDGYVPRTYGAGNRDSRVVLRAQLDSWVQIQGANNELVLTRMLRAGDTYLVPDRDDLIMMTGNAGGLEIVVDGRPIPRMGPEGAVRRNISLAAERLLELASTVE